MSVSRPSATSAIHAVSASCRVVPGDPVVVEVEAEGFGVPVAQGEGGGGFGGVGDKSHDLGQVERAVGGGDVAEDAAGADRGELLIVTDATLDSPRSP